MRRRTTEEEKKKRSTFGHFFPLSSNVYVNSLALGGMKRLHQRSLSSGNKHQQIPSNPHSLTCSHKYAYTHICLVSLQILPFTTTSPGTKPEAWEKDGRPLAPCLPLLRPAQGGDGRKLVSPQTPSPSSHGVRPSPPASITFEDYKRPESNTGKCTGKNVPAQNKTDLKNNEIKSRWLRRGGSKYSGHASVPRIAGGRQNEYRE